MTEWPIEDMASGAARGVGRAERLEHVLTSRSRPHAADHMPASAHPTRTKTLFGGEGTGGTEEAAMGRAALSVGSKRERTVCCDDGSPASAQRLAYAQTRRHA